MTIEDALAEIVRVRDCPAVRRLCLDCWQWSQDHGEKAGLEFARMLLDGVRAYQQHENTIKSYGKFHSE